MEYHEALERAENFKNNSSESVEPADVILHLVDEYDCDEDLAAEVVEDLFK